MTSEEEYLEGLLKNLTKEEVETEPVIDKPVTTLPSLEETEEESNRSAESDIGEDVFAGKEEEDLSFKELPDGEELRKETREHLLSQQELDEMFAEMEMQAAGLEESIPEEIQVAFPEGDAFGDIGQETDPPMDLAEMDIGDLMEGMEADENLSEIKGLLDKDESNELVDDDMLALLEGVSDYGTKADPEDEDFLVYEEELPQIPEKERKETKKKSGRRKKEKKEKREEQEEFALNEFDQLLADGEKKTTFFGRLFAALTESEEEECSDSEGKIQTISPENQEILDELEKEDKKTKKKKEKKPQKEKKGKKASAAASEDEDPIREKEEAGSGAKKKPKKEKVKKKKEEPELLRKEKKISPKKIMLVVIFCGTITAAIVTLNRFIPDYQERAKARTAYLNNDYKAVYHLLYQKNLSQSDNIMFQQASVVLQMERKVKSFQNYQKLYMPDKALHALLQGVARYEELSETGFYGADTTVNEIYQNILSLLNTEYQLSEQDAKDMLAYDGITYTQTIHSLTKGTEPPQPAEGGELPASEEEEIP